jgi:hypothetical protein
MGDFEYFIYIKYIFKIYQVLNDTIKTFLKFIIEIIFQT